MKITDKMAYEAIGKPKDTFAKLKKREPKTVEYIKLGIQFEQIIKNSEKDK